MTDPSEARFKEIGLGALQSCIKAVVWPLRFSTQYANQNLAERFSDVALNLYSEPPLAAERDRQTL